ncbi:MAG: SpoIID/LytB domain-containing protein [Actinomycetales bacterium]|nr:SpoIID/LytB domain-containing protein [Actinomycetales bacterium]
MSKVRLLLIIAIALSCCGSSVSWAQANQSTSSKIKLAGSPSASPNVSSSANAVPVPAAFSFHGSGFGHGIGLSQYGAQGMASDGAKSDEIIEHYFPGTAVTPMPMPSSIVVGILQDRTPDARRFIALRSEGVGGNAKGLSIYLDAKKLTIAPQTAVTFAVLNNQVVAYGKDGLFKDSQGNPISGQSAKIYWAKQVVGSKVSTVVNVTSSTNSSVAVSNLGNFCKFNNCQQRYKYGSIKISPYKGGTLNITNTLRLTDEYLYGLGEMPSSWLPAALQAQAIAGRSYAFKKVQANPQWPFRSQCACQIYATTVDQNFVGFAKEHATAGGNWVAAVKATGDQVATYQGQVISTFYSSSTGGFTQPLVEAWGTSGYPWLTKVDDHWSTASPNPNAKWTKTITQASLVAKLQSAGINVKDVSSFTISDHYDSGAVKQMTVVDSAGRVTVISSIPSTLKPDPPNISPSALRSIFELKATYVRSVTASKKTVPGAANNRPDVLQLLNVAGWPATTGLPRSNFAVSGTVKPIQVGLTVALSDFQDGKWIEVATTTTDLSGAWSMSYPAVGPGIHKLRVQAKNSVSTISAYSQDINLSASVTLFARAKTKRVNSTTTLFGGLTPQMKSTYVYLYRKQSKYGWVLVGKTTTNSLGKFSFLLNVGKVKGTAIYRAKVQNSSIGRALSSPTSIEVR